MRISDIADELGLSIATVSNVIHGKTGKVSDRTVKRVQQALEQRNYIPSMAAVLLAQNNSKIIGVVIHDNEKYEGHVLEDGFVMAAVNALAFQINQEHLFMMLKTTKCWEEIATFASMWNMTGLVLMGFCEADYRELRSHMRIPFVVYDGYFAETAGVSNIIVDNQGGARLIGEYLQGMGHQKVLCIADNDICMDHERYVGLRDVLPDAGFLRVPMFYKERMDFYRKHLPEIMSYTAVFAVSDYYAIDLIRFLALEKIRVPEDLSVTGFDGSIYGENLLPSLTTVSQDFSCRADWTIKLLKELQEDNQKGKELILPVSLTVRDSVKKCTKKEE